MFNELDDALLALSHRITDDPELASQMQSLRVRVHEYMRRRFHPGLHWDRAESIVVNATVAHATHLTVHYAPVEQPDLASTMALSDWLTSGRFTALRLSLN